MTEVTISYGKKDFELEAKGHADFDVKGKDLVCAGISTILTGLANAVYDRFEEDSEIVLEEGYVYIRINSNANKYVVEDWLDMVQYQLETIQESYPKNLSLNVVLKK